MSALDIADGLRRLLHLPYEIGGGDEAPLPGAVSVVQIIVWSFKATLILSALVLWLGRHRFRRVLITQFVFLVPEFALVLGVGLALAAANSLFYVAIVVVVAIAAFVVVGISHAMQTLRPKEESNQTSERTTISDERQG
jgi:hypothetical protein